MSWESWTLPTKVPVGDTDETTFEFESWNSARFAVCDAAPRTMKPGVLAPKVLTPKVGAAA